MSDKSIVITEKDILVRFDEMCQETLSPDVYSIWKDQIIPALNKIRRGLQESRINELQDKVVQLEIQMSSAFRELQGTCYDTVPDTVRMTISKTIDILRGR